MTGVLGAVKAHLPARQLNRLRTLRSSFREFGNSVFAVDKSAFTDAIAELGLGRGDVVYVRSSYDDMGTIRATPLELIQLLCDVVSEDGTIMMPTYPTNGLTYPYLVENPNFHWRRTPSMSGLVTEVFRRMKGTKRSLHPTHSVAVWGKLADDLARGHENAEAPFDESSPYQKLLPIGAKLLSIGRFDTPMPLRHLADDLIQDRIPFSIYCDAPVEVTLVGPDKKVIQRKMRTHRPGVKSNQRAVASRMEREGLVKRSRAGRVPMTLVSLESFLRVYEECAAEGVLEFRLEAAPPDAVQGASRS